LSQLSRRFFVAAAAGGVPAATIAALRRADGGACVAEPEGAASTIVTGARVLTMDPTLPLADAVAWRGDRILAVGSADYVEQFRAPGTTVIDARGQALLPGFIDAHSHPMLQSAATGVDCGLPSIAEVMDALARQAAATAPGHWVVGIMYDDSKYREGRPITRRDLDGAAPRHPVIVRHRGGHTAVVNSRAFELAGIGPQTPDPVGGKYFRDAGELTRKVAELAVDTFEQVGTWPVEDRATRARSAALMSQRMAAAGLTSTTDAACQRDSLIAYQDARDAGELRFRISIMPFGRGDIYPGLKSAGLRSGFGDDVIRIGAVKYVADGSASERTMRMSTPYAGRPDDFGILTMDQAQIDAAVADALANGFRIGIHANGDVTIKMVLDAYERALQGWSGPNPRLRIEHCSLVDPELIGRIKALGVIPAPFYTYAYYHGEKWSEYGEEKMNRMFAHRSFLDAGVTVAPASDFTPGPFEPMMALQSMVTRKDRAGRVWGPSQRITLDQALRICTVHGAYASFEESVKGTLSPGKLADCVLLEKDPHDVDPEQLVNLKVLRTVLGGRTVHEA
jgi:predicted amidohydrolase YtcJ